MSQVTMDKLCDVASAIVEYYWDKEHYPTPHTVEQDNGDWAYIEPVQDEFNIMLDMIEDMLNG